VYIVSVVTRLEPGVMEYWMTKCQLLTEHGMTKQQMDCQLHLLPLLPDSDADHYMEIVRELVKVPSAFHLLCLCVFRICKNNMFTLFIFL